MANFIIGIIIGGLLALLNNCYLSVKEWLAERRHRRVRYLDEACAKLEDILSSWLVLSHQVGTVLQKSSHQSLSVHEQNLIQELLAAAELKLHVAYMCTIRLRILNLHGLADDLTRLLNSSLKAWREFNIPNTREDLKLKLDQNLSDFAKERNVFLGRFAEEIELSPHFKS